MNTVYDKIEVVIKKAGRSLAAHEFADITLENPDPKFPRLGIDSQINGRAFVGCSESALGRRMRKMRELGRLTSQLREGKAFVEFGLAAQPAAAAPEHAHSGGY